MASCRPIRLASAAALALLVLTLHHPPGAHGDVETDAAAQAEQIERYQAELERQRRWQDHETQAPGGERPEPPVPVAAAGECIEIEQIEVDGATLIAASALGRIVSPFEGRCLVAQDLNQVLQEISFLYVDDGYITSRAYLPEQDLSDGTLEIVVVEGMLEQIVVDGAPGEYRGQIGTAFPGLQGEFVNLRDIEQGLDQINRLQSMNATIELAAGSELGGSVLAVNRGAGKSWQATLGTDNLGGAFTGQQQTRLNLGMDDLFGVNEHLSASYQRSMASHPLDFSGQRPYSDTLSGDFSLPYGYWTLAVSGSWNRYRSLLVGRIAPIKTSGTSITMRGKLSRVLYRDQVAKLTSSATLSWQDTASFVAGQRIEVSSRRTSIAAFDLVYARQLWGGQITGSLGLDRGLKILGALDDAAAPAPDYPKAQFRLVNYSLGHTQPLRLGPVVAVYTVSLTGQWSPDRLFGSQQMSLGGPATVRGVREAVLFGNRAELMRNEFSVRLPAVAEAGSGQRLLEPYAGVDLGRVIKQEQYGIKAGFVLGATLGARLRREGLEVELAYSELLYAPKRERQGVQSGVLFARASMSF